MSVFIIAEAGVNHNGSLELAKRLVDVAVDCGADAVKFQSFKAELLASPDAPKAEYQREEGKEDESQYQMLKRLELSKEDFIELKDYCRKKGIMFLCSPFDIESARFLKELGMEIFKIPSGEITNYPLLREIGSYKVPVILSSGMADLGEIEDAIAVLTQAGMSRQDITVLHCNTDYPTAYEDVNLRAMITIRQALKVPVGYSDHTPGIEVSIAAVAMGADVIEKHFTLSKDMEGPDHKASLEPSELKSLVRAIRNVEKSLGDGIKRVSRSEVKNRSIARKSIVARTYIKRGQRFSEENLTTRRPGTGLNPMCWPCIIGKIAPRDFVPGEPIEL